MLTPTEFQQVTNIYYIILMGIGLMQLLSYDSRFINGSMAILLELLAIAGSWMYGGIWIVAPLIVLYNCFYFSSKKRAEAIIRKWWQDAGPHTIVFKFNGLVNNRMERYDNTNFVARWRRATNDERMVAVGILYDDLLEYMLTTTPYELSIVGGIVNLHRIPMSIQLKLANILMAQKIAA